MNTIKNKDIFRKIMLIIEESCNLECTYCYEHHKTNSKMTFSTAKRCIDNEMKLFDKNNIIEIEFIGGEAFLAFDLIKQIVEYVDEKYYNWNIHYICTTNGTLIHGEIQKWIEKHKNFFCSLSLDGTKSMHDINRPFRNSNKGSFDSIDLDFFLKNWNDINAKMTISPETLPHMVEGIKFIEELGFTCSATFATGIDWTNENNIKVLIEQLEYLVDYYKNNPDRKLCQLLAIDLCSVFVEKNDTIRYCGAGIKMHAYDVNGNQYPCQGFAPITLGKEANKYIKCNFENIRLPEETPCRNCIFLHICPDCYSSNKASTGNESLQSKEMCVFNRLCILASAKIQYIRLIKKEIQNFTIEDQKTLKAISIIQKEIFNKNNVFLYNDIII